MHFSPVMANAMQKARHSNKTNVCLLKTLSLVGFNHFFQR